MVSSPETSTDPNKYLKSVENLILFDTEIPNHRPPFIRMFSTLSYFPFANWMFRQSLKSKNMVKSKFMFKEFYNNKSL